MDIHKSDFLVIGGGIAGLTFALQVADLGTVHLLLKDPFEVSSSNWAQGGINAVISPKDSFDSHVQDTLNCGYGLCNEKVVRRVVERGPEMIEDLVQAGVDFTREEDEKLALHREGGHSHNRVVHSKDATGAAIMKALKARVMEHPKIEIYEGHMAIDLILQYQTGGKAISPKTRTVGAYVLNPERRVCAFVAGITYLATGGNGKVYPYTSNPRTATGDGIAMAYRAGIEVVNMEFIQFHPTVLYHHRETTFLISEAVRGEGGILRNKHGEAFMERYHDLKDLAPRDVVARAIDNEIKRHGENHVWLDVTHLGEAHIKAHFPNIYNKLLTLNIDITKDMIPVVPGAHYSCGGLRVDKYGRTACRGLYAGGECTHTGLHGANRMASNSLLEAAVYGKASAEHLRKNMDKEYQEPPTDIAPWVYHNYSDEYEESLVSPLWREVRQFMWNYVGIIRTDKRLARAMGRIQYLREEIEESYWDFRISKDLVELRNISIVAELIIRSASLRKESRGSHYSADHPRPETTQAHDTVISLQKQGLFR